MVSPTRCGPGIAGFADDAAREPLGPYVRARQPSACLLSQADVIARKYNNDQELANIRRILRATCQHWIPTRLPDSVGRHEWRQLTVSHPMGELARDDASNEHKAGDLHQRQNS